MKKAKLIISIILISLFANHFCFASGDTDNVWRRADSIVAQIQTPKFKNETYNIIKFGAVADGVTDCTKAFKTAIERCNKRGGGKVLVPKGKYYTGAIHLLSNVNLHLEEGAEIIFSRDSKKYLPAVFTRFGGMELINYSPFVYAYGQENIAITGKGTLNGNANDSTWWKWNGWGPQPRMQVRAVNKLYNQAQKGVPVEERIFGEGDYIRPMFFQPYKCNKILIQGVTFTNTPAWTLHPVLCTNVTFENVTINSIGPNNDGLNPESCNGVYIYGCTFITGDDCIAIKAAKDHDGRRLNVPCENIVIRNCLFADGNGGVAIGSEMTGGVRNVFAENCVLNSGDLHRAVIIKTNTLRGGFVEDIYVRNFDVEGVQEAVVEIDMGYYDKSKKGKHLTKINNIVIENIRSKASEYGVRIEGDERMPIGNVIIKNCKFENTEKEDVIQGITGYKRID